MHWIARFIRIHIHRRYWIMREDANDNVHSFPNRDLMRHEAINCWCGPLVTLHNHGDGDCWHYEHHSLDAREGRTR